MQVTNELLVEILESYPKGGLTWTLATEIQRLSESLSNAMRLLAKQEFDSRDTPSIGEDT